MKKLGEKPFRNVAGTWFTCSGSISEMTGFTMGLVAGFTWSTCFTVFSG